MKHKKITFLYQESDDNKINMIQSLAHIWHEDEVRTPVYDEEYEWAKCLTQRGRYFRGDLLLNRPALVGAITVANSSGDIVWVEDAGPHPKTTAKERDEVISDSYDVNWSALKGISE